MSNAEEGIAKAQAEAVKAAGTQGNQLQAHQRRSIVYLNERIVVFLLTIAILGLLVLWLSASSPWLLYGSLVGVILLLILWGMARIKRIENLRRERAREAGEWESKET